MQKRIATIVLGVLSIPALGGVAYAASHSVSDTPSPQVVIPASARSSVNGADDVTQGTTTANTSARDRGTDDTTRSTVATGGTQATSPAHGDDPATHDVGDDHGGANVTAVTTTPNTVAGDDGPNHDAGDDHGNRGPSSNSGRSSSSDDSGRSGS
jgi:hypothetical protein